MNRAVCALLCLTVALAPRVASAFCRTHACNPANPAQHCMVDDQHCVTTGDALAWPNSCVSFSVQQDGSKKYGITADAFGAMITAAFERWISTSCLDGSLPALSVENIGPAACDQVEFNLSAANANVWMFRDDVWPYTGGEDALGLSTVHYDPDTGVIQDVDVEINAADTPLSLGDPVDSHSADLESIVTHEAGHFLGLSHTLVAGSTMIGGYKLGDSSQRMIGADDSDGLCAAYPAGRTTVSADCAPRRGFSATCGGELTMPPPDTTSDPVAKGCAVAPVTGPLRTSAWGALVAAACITACGLRRTRSKSSSDRRGQR